MAPLSATIWSMAAGYSTKDRGTANANASRLYAKTEIKARVTEIETRPWGRGE